MARARRSTNGFHSRSAYVVAGIQAAKPFCSSSLKWMLTQNGFQESVNLGKADPSSFKCGRCSTTWSKSATCFLFCTLVVDAQHAQHPGMRGYKRPVHRAVLLDEVSSSQFVVDNKKLLQSHVNGAELGQSATQLFAYEVFLWRTPIMLTTSNWSYTDFSNSDKNWLSTNSVAVHIADKVFERTHVFV